MKYALLVSLGVVAVTAYGENPAGVPADYKLIYAQDFAKPDALGDFAFTDQNVWTFSQGDGKPAMELTKQSAYVPAFRSPFNIALLKDKIWGDVIFEADCLHTGAESPRTDMVFIFGYQSPTKFYYAHVAQAADEHHHNCFIVNDAPRAKFASAVNKGVSWGLAAWHHVRVERKAADGSVRIFFDDMEKPVMQADDKTFGAGAIGFGSFDDTGKVANIRVWSKDMETKETPTFPKAN